MYPGVGNFGSDYANIILLSQVKHFLSESHGRKHSFGLEKASDYPGPVKRLAEDCEKVMRRRTGVLSYDGPSSTIKRILLTRRYKDHNIYNDLGIRVVGGKRMSNGDLGAFVSAVNQAKNNQILGEVKEGDQVLEWNGVLLNGKTFEEVERIVNSSSGEVEIILKSEGEESHRISNLRKYYQNRDKKRSTNLCTPSQSLQKTFRTNDVSPDRTPPVPMHRRNGYENSYGRQNAAARIYDNVDGLNFADDAAMKKQQDSLGYLQIAVSYDRHTSRLIVRIIAARGLKMRDPIRHLSPNPFVKIYLLPVRKVSNKRRTRFVPCSTNPEWNQIVEWQVSPMALSSLFLEFSVWDYDRVTENNALGQVTISLADRNLISGQAFWLALQPLTNPRSITQHFNVPLDNERPQVYQYNSASLDIGYPAIN